MEFLRLRLFQHGHFLRSHHDKESGFTLLEIVVVVGIISLMSAVIYPVFSNFRTRQTIESSVEMVLSVLSQAHVDTISSKNDLVYGVRFKNNETVYFRGMSYPGDSDPGNLHYELPSNIEITNIVLNGGGVDVIYNRLSGSTNNFGTLDVQVRGTPSSKTTITVSPTGVASF